MLQVGLTVCVLGRTVSLGRHISVSLHGNVCRALCINNLCVQIVLYVINYHLMQPDLPALSMVFYGDFYPKRKLNQSGAFP